MGFEGPLPPLIRAAGSGLRPRQIGSVVDTFWLRGPLAISAVEQTRFLDRLARQVLPFPLQAQRAVRPRRFHCPTALVADASHPSPAHPVHGALTNL